MPVSGDFHRFVLEQLAGLGPVVSRSMFGGVGLYHDGLFFGLIDDDTLFLKVDATNRDAYVARGMKPFCPYPDKPEYKMGGYYQVPVEVLEDGGQLEVWARQSRQVALTARGAKRKSAASTGQRKATGKKARPRTAPRGSKAARPGSKAARRGSKAAGRTTKARSARNTTRRKHQ